MCLSQGKKKKKKGGGPKTVLDPLDPAACATLARLESAMCCVLCVMCDGAGALRTHPLLSRRYSDAPIGGWGAGREGSSTGGATGPQPPPDRGGSGGDPAGDAGTSGGTKRMPNVVEQAQQEALLEATQQKVDFGVAPAGYVPGMGRGATKPKD